MLSRCGWREKAGELEKVASKMAEWKSDSPEGFSTCKSLHSECVIQNKCNIILSIKHKTYLYTEMMVGSCQILVVDC